MPKRKYIDIHCLIEHDSIGVDDVGGPDEDGHMILASMKHAEAWPVEVLVEADLAPAEVAVILRKMADWVEGYLMSDESIRNMAAQLHRHEERERQGRRLETEKAPNYELSTEGN